MIILGTYDFAMGMKLAGIKDAFVIETQNDFDRVKEKIDTNDLIIANDKVVQIVPKLEKYKNLVTLPDNTDELLESADLQRIVKSAIGVELKL